jgi:hypothetical protein
MVQRIFGSAKSMFVTGAGSDGFFAFDAVHRGAGEPKLSGSSSDNGAGSDGFFAFDAVCRGAGEPKLSGSSSSNWALCLIRRPPFDLFLTSCKYRLLSAMVRSTLSTPSVTSSWWEMSPVVSMLSTNCFNKARNIRH